ncbi:polyhydroxyalkanoate depolymerase [Siculibacillus lacustris]|uniref:Polyhydroxyalkanoate depolymerase n=1 Tax=Siculibacillus lacustris TaxID=1549641 RepID=A0A4Q9VS04_9HYPH|nr:polyhydroxyalkanoate depolymerase [Siculibacillus lacustris]TBW38727.1 polyhydroxyalkanoate depolymerase [Siculibacillus lacustris]
MLYFAYQSQNDVMDPIRTVARSMLSLIGSWNGMAGAGGAPLRSMAAAYELIARAGLTHTRPAYGIESVTVGNETVAVVERSRFVAPFGTLLHFKKDVAVAQPRVLVVAPLSGHFATLLRNTVRTLLADHDVYITDWHNARDVPLAQGPFAFDDYVETLMTFLRVLGPGTHVVAVCQPCVQVLAAAALLAEDDDPAQPRSMTLMAGPIDTRINPTKVNELASSKPIEWFEKNLIATVPGRYPGAGRRVYPGFVQLSAFMAMNIDRHVKAHVELYENLSRGDIEKAAVAKTFYDEYFAVLDLDAEFYLETVARVFQEAQLAEGTLAYRGRKVDPRAIRRTALLTVEGERDDICALGQTAAAHDLTPSLKPYRKRHHMQAGVGHYGVFSGRRWENQIYPIVRNVILSAD